jgi:hypothetical protein
MVKEIGNLQFGWRLKGCIPICDLFCKIVLDIQQDLCLKKYKGTCTF